MKSLPIENATRRLGAPKSWDHSEEGICHTLDIIDTDDGYMMSAWQPSEKELARMNAGEPLFLYIQGRAHPVVGFSVGYERPISTGNTTGETT